MSISAESSLSFPTPFLADCHPNESQQVPASIGGWLQWSAALTRVLRSLDPNRPGCVVIDQPERSQRFVQVIVTPEYTHIEASSNAYLAGASQLNGVEERLLVLLGYAEGRPGHGHPAEASSNWTLPIEHGDWITVVETVTATLVGIFGFSEQLPVRMQAFPIG